MDDFNHGGITRKSHEAMMCLMIIAADVFDHVETGMVSVLSIAMQLPHFFFRLQFGVNYNTY
jgi:hypothetical protein